MKRVFADTFYVIALINQNDEAHGNAVKYSREADVEIYTTAWVLTELADALSSGSGRSAFWGTLKYLQTDPLNHIVPASQALFERGVELFAARPDKQWSLTDCISFVVMRQHGISEALTGDRRFEQAGYKALLA